MKKVLNILLLSLMFFMMLMSFAPFSNNINADYIVRGNYDPDLGYLSDHSLLSSYLDELNEGKKHDTAAYVRMTDSVLQMRFYHGTSRYDLDNDWLAYLLGAVFWDDFRMIVKKDDILKGNVTACNQMAILFQGLLKEKGIKYRSVGLNRHLITEVWYNGAWHYHDPDYEPVGLSNLSADALLKNHDLFESAYRQTPGIHFNEHFEEILKTKAPSYYPENQILAPKLSAFHDVSNGLSEYSWLAIALVLILFNRVFIVSKLKRR